MKNSLGRTVPNQGEGVDASVPFAGAFVTPAAGRRYAPPLKYRWLLSGSGVMGSGLVVNRLREAESLRVGPDREVDPLVALVAKESESHGRPDQVDDPA